MRNMELIISRNRRKIKKKGSRLTKERYSTVGWRNSTDFQKNDWKVSVRRIVKRGSQVEKETMAEKSRVLGGRDEGGGLAPNNIHSPEEGRGRDTRQPATTSRREKKKKRRGAKEHAGLLFRRRREKALIPPSGRRETREETRC